MNRQGPKLSPTISFQGNWDLDTSSDRLWGRMSEHFINHTNRRACFSSDIFLAIFNVIQLFKYSHRNDCSMFMKIEYTHRIMQKNVSIEYEGFFGHGMAGPRQVINSITMAECHV